MIKIPTYYIYLDIDRLSLYSNESMHRIQNEGNNKIYFLLIITRVRFFCLLRFLSLHSFRVEFIDRSMVICGWQNHWNLRPTIHILPNDERRNWRGVGVTVRLLNVFAAVLVRSIFGRWMLRSREFVQFYFNVNNLFLCFHLSHGKWELPFGVQFCAQRTDCERVIRCFALWVEIHVYLFS